MDAVLLLLYVDHILVCGEDFPTHTNQNSAAAQFKIKDLGIPLPGIEINRQNRISISQKVTSKPMWLNVLK